MIDFLGDVAFEPSGLVPVIVQQFDTGEVLMFAWMNEAALGETIATRKACYFSRSRGRLWRKGERSGQTQRLVDVRLDCDGDCVLLLVDQQGVACHTGRRSCFFRAERYGETSTLAEPDTPPEVLYG